MDVKIFESAKKNLRIQKYPAICGRGLNNSHVVSKNWQSQILLFDFLNDVLRRSINYLYRSVWQIGKQLTETNNTPVSLNFIFLHL